MQTFRTLSETMNELRKEGYTEDFNLQQNCIECRGGAYRLCAEDFIVYKYFRFEGQTDPGDQAILYAISSDKNKLKGVLVNAYGIYSEPVTDDLIRKLEIRDESYKIKGIR